MIFETAYVRKNPEGTYSVVLVHKHHEVAEISFPAPLATFAESYAQQLNSEALRPLLTATEQHPDPDTTAVLEDLKGMLAHDAHEQTMDTFRPNTDLTPEQSKYFDLGVEPEVFDTDQTAPLTAPDGATAPAEQVTVEFVDEPASDPTIVTEEATAEEPPVEEAPVAEIPVEEPSTEVSAEEAPVVTETPTPAEEATTEAPTEAPARKNKKGNR